MKKLEEVRGSAGDYHAVAVLLTGVDAFAAVENVDAIVAKEPIVAGLAE
jgi:hypothetical protein